MREHLRLVMGLDLLLPGAADTRSVDATLRERIAGEGRLTAARLVRAAGTLRDVVPDLGLDPGRGRHLAAQLTAVEWTARRLAGQAVPVEREIELVYGVRARPGEEDAYRAAHRELDALLPGPGPLTERLVAHRARGVVPPERLVTAAEALAGALRDRSAAAGLPGPADGGVTFALVGDAPWSALQQWCGDGRSRVSLNAGVGLRRDQLAPLVAHESYPGHHVERIVRETELVAGRGWVEHGVTVVASPQSVLAEGAAEVALSVLVGPEWGRWSAEVLADVGLPFDGELAQLVDRQLAVLRRVRLDAALMLHGRRAHPDDVLAHLRRWLPAPEQRARQVLRFLLEDRWRGYVVTYVEGAPLVERWLRRPGGDPLARLRELYRSPLVPGDLLADVERASTGCSEVA